MYDFHFVLSDGTDTLHNVVVRTGGYEFAKQIMWDSHPDCEIVECQQIPVEGNEREEWEISMAYSVRDMF